MSPWWCLAPATLLAVFAVLFRKMASRVETSGSMIDWLSDFRLDSYAPLQRLLSDEEDFRFLAGQPGYRPEIAKKLRTERKKILNGYFRSLTNDFNHLLAIAKMMVIYSERDRPDLAWQLWRQQVTFYAAILALRLRLMFYPMALGPAQVTGVIETVGRMRSLVQELTPEGLAGTI
jgi:hypothetical protein